MKHLAEDIEAAVTLARARGAAEVGAPPDDEEVAGVHALEQAVLGGALTGGDEAGCGSLSGSVPVPEARGQHAFAAPPGEARSDEPTVGLRLVVPSELGALWRGLAEVHRSEGLPGSFLAFACASLWAAWPHEPPTVAYHDVYLRDRGRCASPWCTRRDVTPHHIVFRARGGGEERANLVSLCTSCHLELVHGGHLSVRGTAGAPVWLADQATVIGRARRRPGAAAA